MNYKEFFVAAGKKILGIILIIGGILGLFLPFLQGIAMIVAGLVLLGNDKVLAHFYRLKKYCVEYVSKLKKK